MIIAIVYAIIAGVRFRRRSQEEVDLNAIEIRASSLNETELVMLEVLGRGSFGVVYKFAC